MSSADRFDLLFDLWLFGQVVARVLDERLAPSGLPADEFGFYGLLGCAGPLTPTEITRWTGMRPSTVTSYVKRLDARGHVRRVPNEADRRSYRLELSAAGVDAWQRGCELFGPLEAELHARLDVPAEGLRLDVQAIDLALRRIGRLPDRPYRVGEE